MLVYNFQGTWSSEGIFSFESSMEDIGAAIIFLNREEYIELYDIDADPEEMNELSSTNPDITIEMLQTIKAKLAEVNKPYI